VPLTHKVYSSRSLSIDSSTFVGEAGRLFYEQTTGTGIAPVLKYSDGSTPGGLPLSGSSLTFSGSTPPLNPHDGLLWWDSTDGRLYIYYDSTWVDASPESNSTVTGITLTMLSVSTGSVSGSGALNYDNTTGVFTYNPADLTGFLTSATVNQYVNSFTVTNVSYFTNDVGYLTNSSVSPIIANSLTNYATQTYVTTRGYITADIFTTTNISTFINDAHYIQNETGVNSVVGTANQVIVTDLGGRNIQLSTPQNLNTTATVQFGDLTVQNISILGTNTNLTSIEIQGYRLYLASSATNLSQINGGGVQLGTTATGVHSIFWNSGGYWDTDVDGIKTLTLEATTSTLGTLKVLNQARFGYVNQDLTLANAYIQVDSNTNNFSQIAIVNHNTGTNASADIVATNDIGDDNNHFIDMGINSSVFSTSSWTVNGANDGYLYVNKGSLAIGTDTPGKDIQFFTGGVDSTNIVASMDSTGLNVDSIKPLTSGGDIVLISTGTNAATVHVPSLSFPNGGLLITQNTIEAYLTNYVLSNIVTYSTTSTDALTIGQYGIINGVAAPYAVFNLNTNTQVVNLGDVLAGQSIVPSTVISKGSTGTTFTNYIVVDLDMSILGQVLPVPGAPFTLLRPLEKPGLDIQTRPGTDIFLNSQGLGDVLVNTNIIPIGTNISNLGSPTRRWKEVWVGPGSIYVQDETLGSDLRLTAINGDFVVAGAAGLNVGQFTLRDNNIYLTDPDRDINIGVTTATGFVNFNRPIKVNTTGSSEAFTVDRTGRVAIHTPIIPAGDVGALNIIGNQTGTFQPVTSSGGMLHITGNDGASTRFSLDNFGTTNSTSTFNAIVARSGRGTVASPSQTLANDVLLRVAASGWRSDTGFTSTYTSAASLSIDLVNLEPTTDHNRGSAIVFATSALGDYRRIESARFTATGLTFVANTITNLGITFTDGSRQTTAFTSTNAVTRVFAGTGTYVSTSTDAVTVWINGDYATTATVNTLIANSLTNFVYTGTVKLSVTTAASGTSALSFTTSTGVFTYTPPNLSAYLTTVTNVAYANTATNLVGGIGVSSITAGTGTAVSTSTGAVTIWALPAQAITSTGTTTTTNYTLDLSGPTFVHWQPTANGDQTVTLTGFAPGRKVQVFITPHRATDIFTFTGVTASQCSNNLNTFVLGGGGVAQKSMMIEIFCTTNAIGGVWIFGYGSQ
jgi:hypothetical protein